MLQYKVILELSRKWGSKRKTKFDFANYVKW